MPGLGSLDLEHIMAFVRIEQRNAHLAGAVRLITVEGREGPVSKATHDGHQQHPARVG